jgi:hypothetical protein
MALYDAFRELPLHVEEVVTTIHSHRISDEFERKTTVVHLRPEPYFRHIGPEGMGEDVTYDPEEHEPHRFAYPYLVGDWTLESFSAHLDEQDLFPGGEPQQAAYRDYRRWAFESAALDLALKQAQMSTGEALGREYRPVRFVSSNRLADLEAWLALYPDLRFKLDPTPEWTDELIATLVARGNVDVVDLKGQYEGTPVDNPADPDLYRRVAEAFPDAWIEDPKLTPETDAVLEPHRDRITWDAPIHSWADVEALPFEPKCLNVKPSRFGTLARLMEFYDRCDEEGIALYGGGQFELAVGRGQIQLLAALFSADGPNDVAPGGYNANEPRSGLETSPLKPLPERFGFRRGVPS